MKKADSERTRADSNFIHGPRLRHDLVEAAMILKKAASGRSGGSGRGAGAGALAAGDAVVLMRLPPQLARYEGRSGIVIHAVGARRC
jgi:hypothetical protein